MTNLTGFVNVIKPTGMTSSDVVIKVKKILKTKKVGHLGTLDPAASGVLPVAVGKATKFFDYFLNKDKIYVALVEFGVETDTLDSFGNITKRIEKTVLTEDVESAIKCFIGQIEQVPPKYSAIKINGKKACDLARDNVEFEIKSRKINIFNIELVKEVAKNKFLFKVHCSAGTYIRTLFADIAAKLETVATTPVIIRTQSGRFKTESGITLQELEVTGKIQTVEDVFADVKVIDVSANVAKKLINGVAVSVAEIGADVENKQECLIAYEGKLIGFYIANNGVFSQEVYLFEG